MPRTFVSNSFASFVAKITDKQVSNTLMIRVIGAGTVYLSQNRNYLEDVDGSGVPRSGMPLSNTDPILLIPQFTGELWARSTVGPSLEIEVDFWRWGGPYS